MGILGSGIEELYKLHLLHSGASLRHRVEMGDKDGDLGTPRRGWGRMSRV